jgi:hypothetical protein
MEKQQEQPTSIERYSTTPDEKAALDRRYSQVVLAKAHIYDAGALYEQRKAELKQIQERIEQLTKQHALAQAGYQSAVEMIAEGRGEANPGQFRAVDNHASIQRVAEG